MTWLGFELDEEVNKGRIQPLLVIAVAVVYRAVGFTLKREIVVGCCIYQTRGVDDFQVFEEWHYDCDLERSD